ncbi:MAG TPA: hypothetical protein VGA56_08765 [Opitutaceae bacterium]
MQQAWATRDADMLARLEAEWEIAADTLGPASPVGRLRAALAEIHSARRDAERKIRHYRRMPEWRFSKRTDDSRMREGIRCDLEARRFDLRQELAELEATIARWEKPQRKRKARRRAQDTLSWAAQSGRSRQSEFAFAFGWC